MSGHAAAGPLKPLAAEERSVLVDVLRGFALLGVLVVNFRGPIASTLDQGVGRMLDLLVTGSFYPLFSFLFGLGFAIQLQRARSIGAGVAQLYLRRMAVLLLIGTAHWVLLWSGDILVSYALFGLLLLPLRWLPTRALALVAVLLLGCVFWSDAIRSLASGQRADDSAVVLADGVREEDRRVETNRMMLRNDDAHVSYALLVSRQWLDYGRGIRSFTDWSRIVTSNVLLLFVLGMLAGRSRALLQANTRRRDFAILLLGAGALFIAGNAYHYLDLDWSQVLGRAAGWGANTGLTFVYVGGIALLFTRGPRTARVLGIFSPAGRMALTNYLLQSVVMVGLLQHLVTGTSRPPAAAQLAICLAFFFAIQVPLSRVWLRHFRHGPAEWVWRSVAYGEPQPWRARERGGHHGGAAGISPRAAPM